MFKKKLLKKIQFKLVITSAVFIFLWFILYFGTVVSEAYLTLLLTVSAVEIVLLYSLFERRRFKFAWTLTVLTILASLYGGRLAFEENYCWAVGDDAGIGAKGAKLIPATQEEKKLGFTEVTPIYRANMNCRKAFNLISALQQTFHSNN